MTRVELWELQRQRRCGIATVTATTNFAYVQEEDSFLALFPHRYDFIYAKHPDPGERPNWQTERRYPLSDRLIQAGEHLYGVRFGAQTQYCLLDIDAGSIYHPQHDAFAVHRICAALEPIGLVSYLACTSSYSGGIHLYFPFEQAQKSWELAVVVTFLLERAGFVLKPGQLEVFPNPKPFSPAGKQSLFNAHRLPLQSGSYLLNENWETIWSDRPYFVTRWYQTQARNEIHSNDFQRTLKQANQKIRLVSGKADKFLHDLNAEIEMGWTGSGQTNRLLGRIALRTYVFHHVLTGSAPLVGQALVDEIVRVARSLPGYADWCNHQHELEKRAQEWARCVEQSRYFPYTVGQSLKSSSEIEAVKVQSSTWNQRQQQTAREKIQQAIATLLNTESLPATATARFKALTKLGIGGSTLYRHRELWHPEYLISPDNEQPLAALEASSETLKHSVVEKSMDFPQQQQPVENPLEPPSSDNNEWVNCASGASTHSSCTSLFPLTGRNALTYKGDRDCLPVMHQQLGRNVVHPSTLKDAVHGAIASSKDLSPIAIPIDTQKSLYAQPPLRLSMSAMGQPGAVSRYLAQFLPSSLPNSRLHREENRRRYDLTQAARQQQRYQIHRQKQQQRLQAYLDSGDPILIAEARLQAELCGNPYFREDY